MYAVPLVRNVQLAPIAIVENTIFMFTIVFIVQLFVLEVLLNDKRGDEAPVRNFLISLVKFLIYMIIFLLIVRILS